MGEPGRKGCPFWKLGLPMQDRGQAAGQRRVPVLPLDSATRTVGRTPVLCAHEVRTPELWIQDVKVSECKQVNPQWPRSPCPALVLSQGDRGYKTISSSFPEATTEPLSRSQRLSCLGVWRGAEGGYLSMGQTHPSPVSLWASRLSRPLPASLEPVS